MTRDLPPLSIRATFRPDSVDADRRTVELIWTTGAAVLRGFWERYYEELSLDPKHVRMGRLNNGAPFLDAHNTSELSAVLGVVESARLEKGQGVAVIRFAKPEDDPEADKVFRKVKDGILQNVSVGYRTYKMEKVSGGEEEIPTYRAIDWEPYEISAVPAGADDGAGFRSSERLAPNPCLIVAPHKENRSMDPIQTPAAPPAVTPPPADDVAARAAEAATRAERERATAIRTLIARHQVAEPLAGRLLADGITLEQARALVLEELATRSDALPPSPNGAHVRVEGGRDLRREAVRTGLSNALMHRVNPTVKLSDEGRQFAHRSLLRCAEDALEAVGIATRSLAPMEIAALALGIRSSHTTSDFPLVLADVAGKTMRDAYAEAPATYAPIARRVTLPDFKSVKRAQLGEAPQLVKVVEGGEFSRGTVGEGKEEYSLATYGRVFAITRQALVNDDMDAFSRIPMLFGRSARDLESDLVWNEITANGNMGDGVALFHSSHSNLAGSGAVISVTTIGAGRAAMRKQKGVNAKQFVNSQAKYLIVPAALETVAEQFVSTALMASASSSVNPFAGRLQVIAEPRLDANSLISWYMAADPGQIDMIEYGYLAGQEGPMLDSRQGFDVDGLEIKCRHDFAAKVIDFRGLYKNPGA